MQEYKNLEEIKVAANLKDEDYRKAIAKGISKRYKIPYRKALKMTDAAIECFDVDFSFLSTRDLPCLNIEDMKAKKASFEKNYNKLRKKYLDDKKKKDESLYKKIMKFSRRIGEDPAKFYRKMELRTAMFGETRSNYFKLGHYKKAIIQIGTFISCGDKYHLMNKYNLKGNKNFLNDKALFAKSFPEEYGRKFWTNDEEANEDDFNSFTNMQDTIFVKPLSKNHGDGACKYDMQGMNNKDKNTLYKEFMSGERIIAEQYIRQHPDLSKFGKGCVNTVRAVCLYNGKQSKFIYAILKIGGDPLVDGMHRGGVVSRIDLENGTLITKGFNEKGMGTARDLYQGTTIVGFKIPYWDEVVELANRATRKIYEKANIGFVGFDIAVTEEGPVVVEANCGPMLNFVEYTNPKNKWGNRKLLKGIL